MYVITKERFHQDGTLFVLCTVIHNDQTVFERGFDTLDEAVDYGRHLSEKCTCVEINGMGHLVYKESNMFAEVKKVRADYASPACVFEVVIKHGNQVFNSSRFDTFDEATAWVKDMLRTYECLEIDNQMRLVAKKPIRNLNTKLLSDKYDLIEIAGQWRLVVKKTPQESKPHIFKYDCCGQIIYTRAFDTRQAMLSFAEHVEQRYEPKQVLDRWRLIRKHSNGGGLVELDAVAEEAAYISKNSLVLDRAYVHAPVRIINSIIQDRAIIKGKVFVSVCQIREDAYLEDNVILQSCNVSGNSRLSGHYQRVGDVIENVAACEFDFGDGLVPAHQHSNGQGWVADSARVDPTAYVHEGASVFEDATVGPHAKLSNGVRVSGSAVICKSVRIAGNVSISGDARITDTHVDASQHTYFSEKDAIEVAIVEDRCFITHCHKFDFGNGMEPAYQHPNGLGWVANSAKVHPEAYIAPTAQVSGNAKVEGSLSNFANVCGDAIIGKGVTVHGKITIDGDVKLTGNGKVNA